METLSEVLDEYGRPVSLYSDKHGIFWVNRTDQEANLTQFSRAAKTLDITIIHANTPQAKGRVERANQTLQDRLVKEMRLRGIDDIDSANRFLPDCRRDDNQRFAVPPSRSGAAYRTVLHSKDELDLILSVHHTRKLSNNLTLPYKNTQYQLQGEGQGYRLRQANVTVCEAFDGAVTLLYKSRVLAYKIVAVGEKATPLVDEKTINHQVDQAIRRQSSHVAWKPAPDHPWRRGVMGRGKGLAAPLGRKAPHSPAGM